MMTAEHPERELAEDGAGCLCYLRVILFCLAATGLIYVGAVVLLDPFGLLGTRLLPPFGVRPNDGSERIVKALEIAIRPYSVLLAGNSRVQLGFDPQSPALGGASAYNAGLPGATIPEQAAAVRYALRHNHSLKTVVWALDDDGLAREGASADFSRSPMAGAGRKWAMWRYLVGGKAALGMPLLLWRAGRRERVRFDGLYVLSERAAQLAAAASFDLALRPMSNSSDARSAAAIAAARAASILLIDQTIETACSKGIGVHLVLPPFHVWYGAVFAASGLAQTSKPVATRHELAYLARGLNQRHGLGCVDIWDFTNSEMAMTSEVPGDRPSPVWWDAIHFRTDFGDEMLSCVFAACRLPAAQRLDLVPDSVLDAAGATPGAIVRNWKAAHREEAKALAARFGLGNRP